MSLYDTDHSGAIQLEEFVEFINEVITISFILFYSILFVLFYFLNQITHDIYNK